MESFIEQWKMFEAGFPKLVEFSIALLAGLGTFLAGVIIARWLRRKIRGAHFGTDRVDATLRPVIASVIYYVVIGATIYAALRQVGVEPTALLAVFGAAGLAIGLALKDTLGNIAAGFMLLILRPLNVGEYIETPSGAGSVQEMGLFSTVVKTAEGLYVFIPNGQIWNNRIQNYNRHTERRLTVPIGVSYEADLKATQALLVETMVAMGTTLDTPEMPHVLVTEFGDSAIHLSARCWMTPENWGHKTSDMRVALKAALDENGIEIPYPQRVVTTRA